MPLHEAAKGYAEKTQGTGLRPSLRADPEPQRASDALSQSLLNLDSYRIIQTHHVRKPTPFSCALGVRWKPSFPPTDGDFVNQLSGRNPPDKCCQCCHCRTNRARPFGNARKSPDNR